jgi:dTDP-4-dehydrorhamnose 3,5-epimerase
MKFEIDRNTGIHECFVLKPEKFGDHRGRFAELFHMEHMRAAGLPVSFKQQNISHSHACVLRGMHAQKKNPMGKLVSCFDGEIFDVCFDARKDSPTFGKWFGTYLNGFELRSLYAPPGTLHGFVCMAGPAIVHYFCTSLYDKESDGGVRFDDPGMGIKWPVPPANLMMSEKDQNLPRLEEWLK